MSDYDDGWLDCAHAFGLDRAEVLSGRNEIERLRAELALDEERLLSRWYQKRAEKAEAAIARVRERCAREDAESARIHGTLNMAVVRTRAVLATIEGEQT